MAPCNFCGGIHANHLIGGQHILMLKNLLCKGRKLTVLFYLPLLKRNN